MSENTFQDSFRLPGTQGFCKVKECHPVRALGAGSISWLSPLYFCLLTMFQLFFSGLFSARPCPGFLSERLKYLLQRQPVRKAPLSGNPRTKKKASEFCSWLRKVFKRLARGPQTFPLHWHLHFPVHTLLRF